MVKGKIIKVFRVSGAVVVADHMEGARMYDVCEVGKDHLIGEIVELKGDKATIQVYEETEGLHPGDPVKSTREPLYVELAPGIIESIYDGIQRPIDELWNVRKAYERRGIEKSEISKMLAKEKDVDKEEPYVRRGVEREGINKNRKWHFKPRVKKGEKVAVGDILGVVKETPSVEHKIMVPYDVIEGISPYDAREKIKEIVKTEFTVEEIFEGEFTVEETIATINGKNICMLQKWPVRIGRPYRKKLPPSVPLITGQRIIDTFFPMAKGGTACIPGPFGSGKTVTQHQLAKWADADIIFFIGCGERGNEMADVLREFPQLKDPRSGNPLMKRTVLVANTSNMPVAAREASIYTGITMAEYYRDMGHNVALMADSTSRWAEASREISGRLGEMPGEEGYPAYLASRLAGFYERAGRVITVGSEGKEREGSLSVIGAVSPPGGDFSEPVTQATLRITKVFWGLDSDLAFRRHFPAINWLRSYSLYVDDLNEWLTKNVSDKWRINRDEAMQILQEEDKLMEIVRIVGAEALPPKDRLLLLTAKSLREDFLHQNATDAVDGNTSQKKQFDMLEMILYLHHECVDALERGVPFKNIQNLEARRETANLKNVCEKKFPDSLLESKEKIQKEIKRIKEAKR